MLAGDSAQQSAHECNRGRNHPRDHIGDVVYLRNLRNGGRNYLDGSAGGSGQRRDGDDYPWRDPDVRQWISRISFARLDRLAGVQPLLYRCSRRHRRPFLRQLDAGQAGALFAPRTNANAGLASQRKTASRHQAAGACDLLLGSRFRV